MVTERSVGNLSVTVLQFAHAQRSAEQLAGVFPTLGRETLEGIVTGHGDGYPWSFNGVIVDSGEAVFLVDRGFGFRSTGTGTPTAELLAESGYDAEAITSIILTHGHGDH
ncbi:MAG: MBL fold metallo-hydrolase, partial [Spirochaetota bacterium]